MTSEYKLTDEFFRNFRFRILSRTVPLMLVAIGGGWYIAGAPTDLIVLAVLSAFVLVGLPLTLGRTLNRQVKSYRTFCIQLDERFIAREQDGHARIEIALQEVTSLVEVPGKAIAVRGNGPHQTIALPATLERFDELRAQLAKIRPIEAKPAKQTLLLSYASGLGAIFCMIVFYRAETLVTIMAFGTLLIAGLIACGVLVFRSPHIDRRTKRGLWVGGMVIASIAARMWFALSHG